MTEITIKPEDQALLDAIDKVMDSWHEIVLPDHEMYPLLTRTLIVKGFSDLPLKKPEKRIFVYVSQVLTRKADNTFYKELDMPVWCIFDWNLEEVTRADGTVITGTTKDDNGNVIEVPIKKSSIDYVRFLIQNKSAHLVDVLHKFMGQYQTIFRTEIDNI